MKRPTTHACDAWQLLIRFSFSQKCQMAPLAAELDLSAAQCHVLRLLDPDQAISMRQVADGLGCDASNVTGLIDRLEARGLVRRRASEEDRRVKALELTPKGARLRAVFLERMTVPPEGLERLTAREQQALVRILGRLLE
jgi:MarR family transcriptional regulator, organic hydroperoxide resistance regulator